MFVCNVKMNSGVLKKAGIFIIAFTVVVVFIVVGYKFYNATSKVTVKDEIDKSKLEVNSSNYTSILKDSHENIDKYIGKEIRFTGFVYRLYDFNDNQFVLARQMIISSNNHAVVVGFLSECASASQFKNGSWIEVDGIIEKGYYHGDIPVIKIKNIKETNIPKDEFVYPPDNNYIESEV